MYSCTCSHVTALTGPGSHGEGLLGGLKITNGTTPRLPGVRNNSHHHHPHPLVCRRMRRLASQIGSVTGESVWTEGVRRDSSGVCAAQAQSGVHHVWQYWQALLERYRLRISSSRPSWRLLEGLLGCVKSGNKTLGPGEAVVLRRRGDATRTFSCRSP